MIEMPQVFADGVVLPTGDPLSLLARPDGWNRVPVMAGTNLDEHKLFMFMSPLYVRRWLGVVPQRPRAGALPGDGRGAQRAVEGDRRRRPGGRDLEDAAERVRVPLRLGRGAEPAGHRRRRRTWAPRTASRFRSSSATGISAGQGNVIYDAAQSGRARGALRTR